MVPAIVPVDRLAGANARLMGSQIAGNQLVGPPLGAWLFVASAAVPFGVDAVSFVVAGARAWRLFSRQMLAVGRRRAVMSPWVT
jgi:hypothetical protein